jgi:hypothetical protein
MTERIITDSNGRKHITTEPLPHPKQFVELGFQLGKTEKAYKATDDLLLAVLMGDIDPMQAMIDRMKIRDAYHEQL